MARRSKDLKKNVWLVGRKISKKMSPACPTPRAVLSWDFGRGTACHGLRPAVTDANHDPREAGVKRVLYQ